MQALNSLQRYSPQMLGLLRVVTALIFIAHGTQKLIGFPVAPASGLPAAFTLFWFGAILETFGGLLLLVGFLTRPVAFILAGEMAYAYWMFHAPRSVYPIMNGGDAAILYCFIFLYLVVAGAGAWSVDNRSKA